MRLPSRPSALLAAVATVLTLTACTATPGPAAPPAAPGPPAGLDRFYAQQLSWGPCAPFASTADEREQFADPQYDCARLEVPLDHAAPEGPTARLGVLRRKALDADARIGSLLVNPGGPGAAGMGFVPSLFRDAAGQGPVAQRFDQIGFDPRGVGASTPTIDCLNGAERDAERADLDVDPSPAGVAQTEAENRQYAQRCTERVGAEVLANVGTRDAARDVDVLRAALGDEKLTYLGYSYGTRLGTAYAEAFPQNVRALVLDGALDPEQSSADREVEQAAGFQQAFDAYAADCARNALCPLGTDPARAVTAFQTLTRPLIDAPLRVGERTLSYPDAITGVTQALYVSSFWPVLSRGLSSLATGDGRLLLALADLYNGRQPDGSYENTLEAFTAIGCMDEQRITDPAAVADLARRVLAAAPYQDPGRGGAVAARNACAFWPVPPTSAPHRPQVDGLPATLVLSVTGDPATPYQAGVALAEDLGASLITVEGDQHGSALQGNACVDGAVAAYLVDLRLPDDDARCSLTP